MFLSIAVPQHFYSHKFSHQSAVTDVAILSTSLNTKMERKQGFRLYVFLIQ